MTCWIPPQEGFCGFWSRGLQICRWANKKCGEGNLFARECSVVVVVVVEGVKCKTNWAPPSPNHHYHLVAPRCDSSIAEENNALIFVVPTIQCILLRQIYLVYRNQADLCNEDLALWADCVLKTRSLKCISCLQPLLWCRECMNELLIALC